MNKFLIHLLLFMSPLSGECQDFYSKILNEFRFENFEEYNFRTIYGWKSSIPMQADYAEKHEGKSSRRIVVKPGDELLATWDLPLQGVFDFCKGDTLELSGYYKYSKKGICRLELGCINSAGEDSTEYKFEPSLSGDSIPWNYFSVRLPADPTALCNTLFIRAYGDLTLWIDNFDFRVNGVSWHTLLANRYKLRDDHEFDRSSRIRFDSLTVFQKENLVLLGKVWGLVKYHHPAIGSGDVNWDYELFRITPRLLSCRSLKERDVLLYDWISQLPGKPAPEKPQQLDSAEYTQFPPGYEWINNRDLGNKLYRCLKRIRETPSDIDQYYVFFYPSGYIPFFIRESSYDSITWDDQGYRLLTLFRFWNAIEYNYPYRDLTDRAWSDVLGDYIHPFMICGSKHEYIKTILSLVARLDDSHTHFCLPQMSGYGILLNYRGEIPVEWEYNGEQYICKSSRQSAIFPGDILLSVDRCPVLDYIRQWEPYVAASNLNGKRNFISSLFLRHPFGTDSVCWEVLRDSVRLQQVVRTSVIDTLYPKYDYSRELDSLGILYATLKDVNSLGEKMDSLLQASKALVLDCRDYLMTDIDRYLGITDVKYMQTFSRDYRIPGAFRRDNFDVEMYNYEKFKIIKKNNLYKKRVILLVDHEVGSAMECLVLHLRAALPDCLTIGSQTAGRNGNVSTLPLPGGCHVVFSSIGVSLPDGGQSQRIGVPIDVRVAQTSAAYSAGRDALIDKAVSLLKE